MFKSSDSPDETPEGASVGDGGAAALDAVTEVAAAMSSLAAERLMRVSVMRARVLKEAALAGRTLTGVVERAVRLELATALRVTEYAAADLIGFAEAMVERYPVVLESLRRARVTERHAEVLVAGVDSVEPEFRDHVLSEGLRLAETLSVGEFRRALRRLIDTVRSATLQERHETALLHRRVVVEPAEEGMVWLSAHIPAVEGQAIFGRLTAIAKALGAQEAEMRTLDQLRADVFGDLLVDGDTTAHPAETRGIQATVMVTVPALTLLDGGQGRVGGAPGHEPPIVEGIGPISVARARELCGGAAGWMRILTHPETGMVLSVGRDRYRPPPALRKLVRWRADRCMAPGCGIPASRCQIDHTVPWEHGGSTSLENLAPMCQGHHTVKHHGGWTVQQISGSGGALEWTSPAGRHYRVEPERRVPVFRTSDNSAPPF